MGSQDAVFLRRTAIVAGVAAAAIAVWRLRDAAMLLFASIVLSLALRSLSQPIARRLRLKPGLALSLTVLALAVALAMLGAFFGWTLQAQISEATALLPQAVGVFEAWVQGFPLGARLLAEFDQLHFDAIPTLLHVPAYALTGVAILAEAVLAGAGAIYFAAQPQLYRKGFLALWPPAARSRLGGMLDETGALLRKWLLAQAIAMLTVGFLVGFGMWLIGAPAPGALGLFAGLAEVVPFAGPVLSAAPALLLALLHGVGKAGWTLLLFVGVQQFEGNLLLPLLQRRVMLLPPALSLFALAVFGVIFGPLGVFLATPLTIVVIVAVKRLYLPTLKGDGEGPA